MRTFVVIGIGLVLLAVFLLVGRKMGGGSAAAAATAALRFIPFWLTAAAFNLVVFGVPAAIAAVMWWRFSKS
jgi:predicted signal transduction protein with EAL and GGDEF domain